MNPGPAPTMVNDWITPGAFILFITLAVIVTVVAIFVHNLRIVQAEKKAKPVKIIEKGECFIEVCHQPGVSPAHTTDGIRYVCRRHEAGVYDWIARAYAQDPAQLTKL